MTKRFVSQPARSNAMPHPCRMLVVAAATALLTLAAHAQDTAKPAASSASPAAAASAPPAPAAQAGASATPNKPASTEPTAKPDAMVAADATQGFKTLDGKAPLVLAHRGLPAIIPEETALSYEAAAATGADSLETDLHLTKDCILVARHNPWLADNTNVAEVSKTNPEVARRKRTVPGVLVDVTYPATPENGPAQYLSDRTDPNDPKSVLKSLVVDGEDHTNDWSISDFTMDELRRWIGGTMYDARELRPAQLNGKLPIISFQELINIAKARSAATGRTISVYPESKNPIWNNAQAIANGCGAAGSHPLEDAILKSLKENDLNRKDAPVFVQSFDPDSLKYLRTAGLEAPSVQLIDGNAVDFKTGDMVFITKNSDTFVSGRPFAWTLAGDARTFGAMLTPAGLAEIKTYADGIGAWKPELIALMADPAKEGAKIGDVTTTKVTPVIADAHKAGLFVHVFTFRNEPKYLAGVYKGDPAVELTEFFEAGVDGVFSDFAGSAVGTRDAYVKKAMGK